MTRPLATAFRRLSRDRLFALSAAGMLALGLGLATSLFSVARIVLLSPLPYRDPERLVWVWAARTDRDKAFFSIANFRDTRDALRTFDAFEGVALWGVNLTGAGEPERLQALRVTTGFLPMLGVRAAAGRLLARGDEERPVAVLTQALARRRFGGDAAALGRTLVLNGAAFEVVGVLPASFTLPNVEGELLAPQSLDSDPRRDRRGTNFLRAVGRLAPGAAAGTAAGELKRVTADLVTRYPDVNAKLVAPRVLPLREELVGAHRTTLALTFAASLLLLLVACSNLSHLLLVRAARRGPELAVERALGAGAGMLAGRLLFEAALLAAAGAAAGLALALAVVEAVARLAPDALPRVAELRLDAPAALFAAGVSLLVALATGVAPALFAARADALDALRGRGSDAGRGRARGVFVNAQVALTVVLLAATGASLAALARLLRLDTGFDPAGVVTFRVSVPAQRAGDAAALARFTEELTRRLAAIPGVTAVTAAQALPLSGLNVRTDFAIAGRPPRTAAEKPGAQLRWVAPAYFATLRIPLLAGHEPDAAEAASGRRVAVVDETLAARFFENRDPLGAHLLVSDDKGELDYEVVGVVRAVKHFALDEEPLPTLYAPAAQVAAFGLPNLASGLTFALRATVPAPALLPAIRQQLRSAAPDVPLSGARSLDDALAALLAPRRFAIRLLGGFALAALLLAAAGIYAVGCQSALARRRENGVRLALGATPRRIAAGLLRDSLARVGSGALAGLALAAAAARLLPANALLPRELSALAGAALAAVLVIAAASTAAALVPALRAARLPPARVLAE